MSFITPLFLIAASTALLPVIAHLVRRRRARQVPFSSLMLLQASPKALLRKRSLTELLLLALRASMLVLLALAFARPFIPRDSLPFVPEQQNRSIIILLDRSFSMQAGGRFEAARQAALRHIDNARPNDELAIVGFSDAAEQLTKLSRDAALHRSLVEGLRPTFRATHYYAPFRLALDILEEARHDSRAVVLISDYQKAGFSGAFDNFIFPNEIALITEQVANSPAENAYFQEFALSMQRIADGVAVSLRSRLGSDGGAATVQLVVDGDNIDERSIPAASTGAVSFRQLATRMGFFQGSMHLAEDALTADNAFYFTYHVAPRPSILVVDGSVNERNAFFLLTAFDLGPNAQFSVRRSMRLTSEALSEADIAFVAAYPEFSPGEIEVLRTFAQRGGGVILSPGQNIDLASYSAALRQLGISGAEAFQFRQSEASRPFILGRVNSRHPVFEPLVHAGSGTLLRARFHKYVRIAPDSSAAVPAAYDSGDPLLIEKSVGAGKVLIYTSTFSTDWTDFPLSGIYVPLLHQLAAYSFSSPATQEQYVVGDVVLLPGASGETWDVRVPGGEVYKVPVNAANIGYFRETERPGHYVAVQGGQRHPFSVNVDPRESVLDQRDEEETYAAIVGTRDGLATVPEEAALLLREEEKEQKLWRVVVMLLVSLFATETFLANRSMIRRPNM